MIPRRKNRSSFPGDMKIPRKDAAMNSTKNAVGVRWLVGCLLCASSVFLAAAGRVVPGKNAPSPVQLALDSLDGLEVKSFTENDAVKAQTEVETYRGRRAVRLTLNADGQALAIVKNSDFKDGTIEADLAGIPRQGAPSDSRGFVGISFRIQPAGPRYETVYLRMTNGRADDQVRRNHSVQYTSEPDFPWNRLRKENPGVYESYVDLDAGAWTKVRIVVSGVKAAVYVNGAEQSCLIVNDLRLGESSGPVALWVGSDTDAHFSDLKVKPLRQAD